MTIKVNDHYGSYLVFDQGVCVSIININSSWNVSLNRDAKSERNGDIQRRTDRAPSDSKQLVALGHSPETKVSTGITEQFSRLPETRSEIVESAEEKLENGYFDERQTAINLAKSFLDIS